MNASEFIQSKDETIGTQWSESTEEIEQILIEFAKLKCKEQRENCAEANHNREYYEEACPDDKILNAEEPEL